MQLLFLLFNLNFLNFVVCTQHQIDIVPAFRWGEIGPEGGFIQQDQSLQATRLTNSAPFSIHITYAGGLISTGNFNIVDAASGQVCTDAVPQNNLRFYGDPTQRVGAECSENRPNPLIQSDFPIVSGLIRLGGDANIDIPTAIIRSTQACIPVPGHYKVCATSNFVTSDIAGMISVSGIGAIDRLRQSTCWVDKICTISFLNIIMDITNATNVDITTGLSIIDSLAFGGGHCHVHFNAHLNHISKGVIGITDNTIDFIYNNDISTIPGTFDLCYCFQHSLSVECSTNQDNFLYNAGIIQYNGPSKYTIGDPHILCTNTVSCLIRPLLYERGSATDRVIVTSSNCGQANFDLATVVGNVAVDTTVSQFEITLPATAATGLYNVCYCSVTCLAVLNTAVDAQNYTYRLAIIDFTNSSNDGGEGDGVNTISMTLYSGNACEDNLEYTREIWNIVGGCFPLNFDTTYATARVDPTNVDRILYRTCTDSLCATCGTAETLISRGICTPYVDSSGIFKSILYPRVEILQKFTGSQCTGNMDTQEFILNSVTCSPSDGTFARAFFDETPLTYSLWHQCVDNTCQRNCSGPILSQEGECIVYSVGQYQSASWTVQVATPIPTELPHYQTSQPVAISASSRIPLLSYSIFVYIILKY
eukprot:GHVL01033187.1.p1 GENE.GHVL01033187.1~~GHVL01033187.1.p1  ORF type:complete len:648 (+),score=99.59 GHVL01033187.1:39-1982(+)